MDISKHRCIRKKLRKRLRRGSGQAAVELALAIPVLMLALFGVFQLARVFYVYHTLHKALRGGAGLLARSANVNYCDAADPALTDARNFIVYGNLQGSGNPVVRGLTPDAILVFPERASGGVLTGCLCAEADSCDTSTGGRAPDFVTVSLGSGFPLPITFPLVASSTLNLSVSVRMPVTSQ